jgi:hypothetical protein
MKVTVLCDHLKNIQSVAILNPAPVGHFHVEVEGGGSVAHEIEVDAHVIEPQALMGKKGHEAQKDAYAKLRRMI